MENPESRRCQKQRDYCSKRGLIVQGSVVTQIFIKAACMQENSCTSERRVSLGLCVGGFHADVTVNNVKQRKEDLSRPLCFAHSFVSQDDFPARDPFAARQRPRFGRKNQSALGPRNPSRPRWKIEAGRRSRPAVNGNRFETSRKILFRERGGVEFSL